ncbi:MAG: tetratricopeptide repeat protein [Deltaproteobacteria bacterium]|nr:tetratricopeptide repeat protein [Deltaproteobacteria bacterium]
MVGNAGRSATGAIALVALLLCLMPRAAEADAPANLAEARALFKQAEIKFGLGSFEKALALYQQAYAKAPLAGFHFNIAQCHRNLGNYRRALFHYRRYLALKPDARNREIVQLLIGRCDKALAAQRNRPTERAGSLPSTPSTNETAAETPPDLEGSDKAHPANDSRKRLRPLWFWTTSALSGALLAGAAITGGLALSKKSRADDSSLPLNERQAAVDSGKTLQRTSTVLFIGAGAAAASAVALFFFTRFGTEKPADTHVTLQTSADGLGLAVSHRF